MKNHTIINNIRFIISFVLLFMGFNICKVKSEEYLGLEEYRFNSYNFTSIGTTWYFDGANIGGQYIVHWDNPNISWYINSSEDADLSFNVAQSAVDASFDKWDDVTTSDLAFSYQDSIPNTYGLDYKNVMYFAGPNSNIFNAGQPLAGAGSNIYGLAILTVNASEEILDAEAVFNAKDHAWDETSICQTAAHEIGHMIGLNHQWINHTIMDYYRVTRSDTLTQFDRTSASFLYGGNIIEDITLPDDNYFDWSIDVNDDVTLAIDDGANVYMATDKKIDVYGTLELNSGSSLEHVDGTDRWSCLDINSGATLTVSGPVTIDRSHGVALYGDVSFTGSTSTISNCFQGGVAVYAGSPTFENIIFEYNAIADVIVSGASTDATFENITFRDSYVGAFLGWGSDTTIEACEFYDLYLNCIFLGSACGLDIYQRHNDFYPEDAYAIECYTNVNIYAQENFWNTNTPGSVLNDLFSHPCYVEWYDWDYPANGAGAPKIATQQISKNPLKVAGELAKNGDWRGAIGKYNDIIETDNNLYSRRMSIKRILQLNKDHNLDYGDIRATISKQLETAKFGSADSWYKASLDFLMCETYVCEGKIDEAISAFNENASKYNGTSMEVESLCRLAIIHADYKRDKPKALEIANKAASLNPGQGILTSAFNSVDVHYDPSLYFDKFEGLNEDFDNLPGDKKKLAEETGTTFFSPSPNPFNPSTTLSYSLANPGHVKLYVYNSTGQKVATLVDSYMSAGYHSAVFDGNGLASGMYFYLFTADGVQKSGRMTLVK